MLARIRTLEIDSSDSSPVSTTAMPNSHLPTIVSSSFALASLGEGERSIRATFVEMVVNGSSKMPQSRCSRLVGFHLEDFALAARSLTWGEGGDWWCHRCGRFRRSRGSRSIAAVEGGKEVSTLNAKGSYSRLEHDASREPAARLPIASEM